MPELFRGGAAAAQIFALATLLGACDAESPQVPGGDGESLVRGTERLGWTQTASAPDVLAAYRFFVFIDGSRIDLSGVTCSAAAAPAAYDCSAPLPQLARGRRVLEVSTIDTRTNIESDRSAPLVVMAAGTASTQQIYTGRESTASPAAATCVGTDPLQRCVTVDVAARDIGPVRRIVALPDGRYLMVRGPGELAVSPGGEWHSIPWQRSEQPVIVDIAVDRDFSSSGFLFATVVTTDQSGVTAFRVVRLRESGGLLGDAATIVPDIPVAAGAAPLIAVGADNLLHIAVSTPADDRPANRQGVVLRYTRDGAAAGDERGLTPVWASGAAAPGALALLPDGTLVLGASGLAAEAPLLRIAGGTPTSAVPLAGLTSAGIIGLVADPPAQILHVLGASPAGLYVAAATAVRSDATLGLSSIPLAGFEPFAIERTAQGALLVLARREGTETVDLLRVSHRDAAARVNR